jgi:hypothetical protein
MTTYNLLTNPSFIANTTGWDGYTVGVVTGLVATLATGTNSVTLTTGTTSNMEVGQLLTKTSGAGAFGNSGVVYVKAITNSTVFTVGLADTTAQNHATLGSITFSAGATATLSLDSTDPLYGTGYSAKITAVDSSPYIGIINGLTDASYKAPVIAGDTYTFSAYVKVPVGQATSEFKLRAYFYASSTLVSFSDAAPQKISSFDGWVRLTFTFTIPATATFMSGLVFRSSTTTVSTGYNFLVDAVQLQTGLEATSLIYDQGQKNKLIDKSLTNVYIDHLTGMKLKADIRLGDFVFNRIDEYGVVWVINNIEGWWTMPQVEVQDLPRGWGDGSYTTYGRFGSRQITITGSFLLQDTDTQLEAARNRLINAINLVKKDAWLVLNEDTPKALKVRISGTPEISTINPRGKTDFSIGLVSADPIKYKWADARDDGYALTTANSNAEVVTIRNEGNTPVTAIFEIIGPTTGPVSLFNKTSEQLIDVIYKLNKYRTYTVTGAEVSGGNLVFTTNTIHGFSSGEAVDILNVVDIFGIVSVICTSANSLDVITSVKHSFSPGQNIYLTGVSGLAGYSNITDGEYYITAVYRGNENGDYKFTITKVGLTQVTAPSVNASGAKFSVWANTSAISFDSGNNIATVNTSSEHGFTTGDQVVISNTSAVYDGTFIVTGTPSTSSFEYNLFESRTIRSITYRESTTSLGTIRYATTLDAQVDDYITIDGVNEDFNGTHKVVSANSTAITFNKKFSSATPNASANTGTVYVSQLSDRSSVAFTSGRVHYGNIYNGYYNVGSVSSNTPTQFSVVRPNFYPNVVNTTITTYDGAAGNPLSRIYAETLSIDTYTRDIALNGEVGGYRSKLDTIVDWIELQPGDNEITFEDLNKNFVTYVAYTTTGNTATITTTADHNFVVGSLVKLIGLNTIAGGSNVFANASIATVANIADTRSFTFVPTNSSGASNINSTLVTSGYIYEVSPAYVNIYYRSGWIG